MTNDTPSSLFSPEVADLFRQASARQDAINNEAAARMYAAIHRGERDIRLLEDIADPLSDAEYAGEEHYRNWQMVDEYDEHWLPLPNETYHPLTTREWTDINEATCQVSSCYFAHSLLTARVRILQLEAEGQTYETSEEYRTLIDFIRKEHDKQDTLRKQHLPHFTADQPQVAPTYIRFWGFWSPEGSSHAPREQYSMLIVPIAQISEIIEDDQYSRIIPLGINYDLGIHPNSHWICEGNIEFIRE